MTYGQDTACGVCARAAQDEDTCHWEYMKTIKLPKEAYFMDYAGEGQRSSVEQRSG